MLTYEQRVARYTAQTGSATELTPKQFRRAGKKLRHQLPEAAGARRSRAEQRAVVREERKARLAGLAAR